MEFFQNSQCCKSNPTILRDKIFSIKRKVACDLHYTAKISLIKETKADINLFLFQFISPKLLILL